MRSILYALTCTIALTSCRSYEERVKEAEKMVSEALPEMQRMSKELMTEREREEEKRKQMQREIDLEKQRSMLIKQFYYR